MLEKLAFASSLFSATKLPENSPQEIAVAALLRAREFDAAVALGDGGARPLGAHLELGRAPARLRRTVSARVQRRPVALLVVRNISVSTAEFAYCNAVARPGVNFSIGRQPFPDIRI